MKALLCISYANYKDTQSSQCPVYSFKFRDFHQTEAFIQSERIFQLKFKLGGGRCNMQPVRVTDTICIRKQAASLERSSCYW